MSIQPITHRHTPYLPFRTFTCVPQWSPQVQEWTIPGTHLRYDIGWSLFNSRHAQCSSRHVLSGGQNVHACRTRRAIKYQLATCYMAKEPWPLLVRKLTSNRHTSARPDSYANSWECSFGLSGDDHGWADEATNKNDTSSIMCHFYWQSIVNEIRTRIILDSPS